MSNFEKISSAPKEESTVLNHAYDHDERREYYFRAIIQSSLMDTVQNALEEAGFSPKEEDLFTASLAELPEEDQLTVLSLPFEIRERMLTHYHKQIAEGTMVPADVVQDILGKFKKHGFTLGYHLSNRQIPKELTGHGETWNIKGTELDDRDGRHMAYYSQDYLNRYKKKAGNFLYIVRAEIGPNSSHKHDLKNHWGRAAALSIIDEYDMHQVERRIDEAMEKEDAATLE